MDPKTQKKVKLKRPPVTLKKGLSVLHLLLQVPSFNRWPLAVRFFCSDVHKAWLESCKKGRGELRGDLKVFLDEKQPAEPIDMTKIPSDPQAGGKREYALSGLGGIDALDITYSGLKSHIEKRISLVAAQSTERCSVCGDWLDLQSSTMILCPSQGCRAVSHMACLARSVPQGPACEALLPRQVQCSQCRVMHQWIDLVRELSLRVRGENDVAKILEGPRVLKGKANKNQISNPDLHIAKEHDDSTRSDRMLKSTIMAENHLLVDSEDEPLLDDWYELGEDSQSVASTASRVSSRHGSPVRNINRRQLLPAVIEDSEWDSAEALD